MNDAVAEKLVQKVINLIEEVNDVNIVVRGITPPQAIVNKIHERIDASLAATQQIEKKLDLDGKRLKELEAQTKLQKDEMELRKNAIHDMEERVIKNNDALRQTFYTTLDTMDRQERKRFEELEKELQSAFETQTRWLMVLSGALAILILIVIFR